jgi:hypothetical protein
VAAPGQVAPTAGAFETSSVGYPGTRRPWRHVHPVPVLARPRTADAPALRPRRARLLDAPTLDDRHWCRMDNVVLSWLLDTITVNLQETTRACDRGRERTAQQLWVALQEQFLGNREAHALHLDTQFRLFVHGDLSVDDYCYMMKRMADDLGEHVEDRTLVL